MKKSSQNIGLKNKWEITPSNKTIERLDKDSKKDILKYNKNHKLSDLKRKEDKKLKVKDNLNTNPTVESLDGLNVNKYKKKRNMYEPNKTAKHLQEQEHIVALENNEHVTSLKKSANLSRKSVKNKKKMLDSFVEEYKPGMLSDSIQMKKYGCVIIPWDPSFGLDKAYKIPDNQNEDLPKLRINPLFDLSKRQDKSSFDKNLLSVFVGNLPSDIGVNEIKKLFKKCGLIHQVKLKNRNDKSSRKTALESPRHRTALVTFKQAESCDKALRMNGKLYKGCHLGVNKASSSTQHEETGKSVFVGNLAFVAEDEDLWKAFGNCGEIQGVTIIRDGRRGTGKGYGYVNFKTEEAVEKALKLDGLSILNRDIRVRRNEIGSSNCSKILDEEIMSHKSDTIVDADEEVEQKNLSGSMPKKSKDQKKHKKRKKVKEKPEGRKKRRVS